MRQLFLTGTILFLMTFPAQSFGQAQGLFTVAKGKVKVTKMDGTFSYGKVGDKVSQSDSIETSANSSARIVMPDTNFIDISANSKILIEKYIYDPLKDDKQVSLKVDFGRMKATVKQKYDTEKNKFNVKTPGVVAGVRGTIFLTSYDRSTQASEVVTLKGLVAVDQLGPNGTILKSVLVSQDQMIKAESSKVLGEPLPVPKDLKENMQREDVKNGFATRGRPLNDSNDNLNTASRYRERGLAFQAPSGNGNKRLQPDQGRGPAHSGGASGGDRDNTVRRGTASEGNFSNEGSPASSPTQNYNSPSTGSPTYNTPSPTMDGSSPTSPGGYGY